MRDTRVIMRAEIDKAFTEVINRYFANGFIAYTVTMGGTQGETAKMDVTNDDGKTIYRIMMFNDYNLKLNDNAMYGTYRGITIEVRKYVNGVDFHHNTIWNDRGEGVELYTWYEVADNKVFTADREFARATVAKRNQRWRIKDEMCNTTDRIFANAVITDKLMTYINNRKGFKAVKKRDINAVWRRDNRYYIDFKNREGRYTVNNG